MYIFKHLSLIKIKYPLILNLYKECEDGFGNDIISLYIPKCCHICLIEPWADEKRFESCGINMITCDVELEEKLLISIETGDMDKFGMIIDSNVNINYSDSSPLSLSLIHKRTEMIKILIDKMVEWHTYDLILAIDHDNDLDTIRLLLEYTDGKILTDDKSILYKFEALKFAAQRGKIDLLKLFYQYLPFSIESKFIYECALLRACIVGCLEVIKYFDDIGVNLNSFNGELLPTAAYHGHSNIINFLLEKGFDIHAHDEKALMAAVFGKKTDIVKLLIENGADHRARDNEPIIIATTKGCVGIVKLLIEYDNDLVFIGNGVLLQIATEHEHIELVKYFLDSGFDLSYCDNYLWYQINKYNKIELIELFIKYGVNIYCDNNFAIKCGIGIYYENNFAIKNACQNGYIDVLKILLKTDPNLIMIKDELIEIANKENKIEIIDYLEKFQL